MSSPTTGPAPSRRIETRSLVDLAAAAIRDMILSGTLAPGDRLIEERLADELGISRPPVREAMRMLQQDGLIVTIPRRGSTVATLTDQDVFEVLTLRSALERLAVELGVPVKAEERLEVCRTALRGMEAAAAEGNRPALVHAGYVFHASIVALAGHRRLDEAYASVQQQLLMCMARNLYVREHYYESLTDHVERHRRLLDVIESSDQEAVLAELAVHGERSFATYLPTPSSHQGRRLG